MSLTIRQEAEYKGKDRWQWSVWLDGTPEELDDVDHVMYVLHHSFPNPVREIRDRSTNFRLDTSGWGTFRIYARVFHKDGQETPLDHDLELRYPDGTLTKA
jgi:transcription initiation factor IIF auxiliary subunit